MLEFRETTAAVGGIYQTIWPMFKSTSSTVKISQKFFVKNNEDERMQSK
jgi:hypothetical protein